MTTPDGRMNPNVTLAVLALCGLAYAHGTLAERVG